MNLNKLLAFSAIIILNISCIHAALLKNGSFEKLNPYCSYEDNYEKAKPFHGWDCLGNWKNNINIGRDAVNGNVSVCISSPSCWISRSVKLKPGNKYKVTGYIRSSLQKIPDELKIGAYFSINSGNKILVEKYLSGTNNWTELTGEFIIPEKAEYVKLNIGLKALQGFCWFDNFSIIPAK